METQSASIVDNVLLLPDLDFQAVGQTASLTKLPKSEKEKTPKSVIFGDVRTGELNPSASEWKIVRLQLVSG